MRSYGLLLPFLLCILFTGACTSEAQDKKGEGAQNVGGCVSDTVSLDIPDRSGCAGAVSPVRISILSVEMAGVEIYRRAAIELLSLLDSLEVASSGGADLLVIRKGPCWPPYRVDIRLDKDSEHLLPAIRSALSGRKLAGLNPSETRPDGYGTFFVQTGVGSSDRWTLWYHSP